MSKKVETVKKEVKTRQVTQFHVYVGEQPVRTMTDEVLAQHFAANEKARLVSLGCDLSLKEFNVRVEEETKEQNYSETVPV